MSEPSKWKPAKLTDFARIVSGATPSTSESRFWGGNIHWVTPKDVSDLTGYPFLDKTPRTLTPEGLASCSAEVLPPNSVLLSSRAPIGLVAINRIPVATNQGFKSFVPDATRLHAGFLYHWLRANRRLLENLGTGATFKEISKAVVSRIEIPVPPLDEQRRIAAVMDMADELRRQREDSLQLSEVLLQSVFIEMFGTETKPACPRARLSDHLDFVTSGGRGWAKYRSSEGAKFIRSLDVQMNEIDESQMIRVTPPMGAEADRTRVRVGDVLLTITGSLIGRVAPVTDAHAGAYVSQHVAILRTHGFQPEFLSWALSTQEGQQQIQKNQTGQTKPGLNFEQIGRLTIPRPSAEMEDTFCKLIRARRLILTEQRSSLQQAHDLFASLQQRAFSGKLDLSRLVLDEPKATIPRSGQAETAEPKMTPSGRVVLAFAVPQAIETTLKKLDDDLKKNETIPWSADYFKYRILGVQPGPFVFEDVMQRAATVFEEAPYEEIKYILFDLLGKGGSPALLRQSFELVADGSDQGEGRKGIVFVSAT